MQHKSISIVLSSDNNYAPFVATTIASICDNTKSFCEFYVLDGGISKENQEKIYSLTAQFNNFSLEFVKVDIESDLKTVQYKNDCKHVTVSTYNRFLIPKLFQNLKKVLYLDIDIIALGDVKELYDIDLEDFSLGAVSEEKSNLRNAAERCIALQLDKNHHYFNAGVLLIDVQKWIREDTLSKLFKCEQDYRNKLKWADQDILNIVFNNHYKELDYKFNYMTDKFAVQSEIILRHFNTDVKPWHYAKELNTNMVKNTKDFWYYAVKTDFLNVIEQKCLYTTQYSLHKLRLTQLLHNMQK